MRIHHQLGSYKLFRQGNIPNRTLLLEIRIFCFRINYHLVGKTKLINQMVRLINVLNANSAVAL